MSPVAEADRLEVGVLGLEAVHQWEHGVPGQPPVLRLNDRKVWPRYVLRGPIGGLHSGPDREQSTDPRLGRIGSAGRPVKLGAKSVSYSGTVYGRTLAELRLARMALLTAFSVQTARTMRVLPDPDYAGGTEHVYSATVLACDCDDTQVLAPTATPSAFGREFVVGLRMDDPRTYRPLVIAAASQGGEATIENGTAPADAVIDVEGLTGTSITVTTDLGDLTVDALDGDCRLDLRRGEVTDAGTGQPVGLIDPSSTLLDAPSALPPGPSTVTITGASSMTVRYRSAWW